MTTGKTIALSICMESRTRKSCPWIAIPYLLSPAKVKAFGWRGRWVSCILGSLKGPFGFLLTPSPGDSAAVDSGWWDDAFWQLLSLVLDLCHGKLACILVQPPFPHPTSPSSLQLLLPEGPDLLVHPVLWGAACHQVSPMFRKLAPYLVRCQCVFVAAQAACFLKS